MIYAGQTLEGLVTIVCRYITKRRHVALLLALKFYNLYYQSVRHTNYVVSIRS